MPTPTFSFIVPVYNRPEEVQELLQSLAEQTDTDFELILVEDGSTRPCRQVADAYAHQLQIHYYAKENTGAGPSRNYGIERASGTYLLFVDSDCILPPHYIAHTRAALAAQPLDYWGGPDRAHPHFSPLQRAISFSMTSWLTTGGIRGTRQNKVFNPRTFNMGVRAELMRRLGGFSPFWPGEDLELAIRARAQGIYTALVPAAWVYHKRRSTLHSFFRQVRSFGRMRIHVYHRQRTGLKPMHFLPALYLLGTLSMPIWVGLGLLTGQAWLALVPPALWLGYNLLLLLGAGLKNGLRVALLSFLSTQVMFFGYGSCLLWGLWQRYVRGRPLA